VVEGMRWWFLVDETKIVQMPWGIIMNREDLEW
jgi:hypothetical protein